LLVPAVRLDCKQLDAEFAIAYGYKLLELTAVRYERNEKT